MSLSCSQIPRFYSQGSSFDERYINLLAVEQVTEVVNVLLQGCVYHWVVVGHYLPNPKLLNWPEFAHECGACRSFMEMEF